MLSNHMLKSYIKCSSCTLLPCESTMPNFLLESSNQETSPAGSPTYHRNHINFIFNCLLSLYLIPPNGSHEDILFLPLYQATMKGGILDAPEDRDMKAAGSPKRNVCPHTFNEWVPNTGDTKTDLS